MKRLAAVIACVLLLAGLTTVTAQSQDGTTTEGKQSTFDIGDPQGIDSMNPLIGVTVAAYEAWNIQYATLTDKAASDFHTIPGLAKSWKGSDDRRTWTYTLRDNLKWSDGKPLTSEDVAWNVNTARDEEWINASSTVVNLTATAPDPTDGRDQVVCRRPEAAHDGHVHAPEAHLGAARQGRARQVRRHSGRRLRPIHPRQVREGAVRPLQGQPELLQGPPGGRPGGAPEVQQPGRDGRRPQERRARRGRGRAGLRLQSAREGPGLRRRPGLPGRDDRARRSTAATA